jgi:pheromone shutdown protein TraB
MTAPPKGQPLPRWKETVSLKLAICLVVVIHASARSFVASTRTKASWFDDRHHIYRWRGGSGNHNTTAVSNQPSELLLNISASDLPAPITVITTTSPGDISRESSFLPQIPESLRGRQTLRKLTLGNVDIYLIGTAHVSNDSSAEVDLLLHAVRPQVVFVELCEARTALLEGRNDDVNLPNSTDDEGHDKNMSFMQKVQSTQHQQDGSRMQALSTVLLTSVQQDYADTLGVELGGEFKCAYRYCTSSLPRPYLLLGDRPLQLTLIRAWESLWWWPKVKVIVGLIWSSLFKPNKEEIRQWLASVMADGSDVLTESFRELQKHLPTLYTTIIDERDSWLAAKLTQTCRTLSSTTSQGLHVRLVAIVGAGHVPGICKKLTANPSNETVEEILLELCQTRKWTKDPVIQNQAIPLWVNEVSQFDDRER